MPPTYPLSQSKKTATTPNEQLAKEPVEGHSLLTVKVPTTLPTQKLGVAIAVP